MKGRKNRSGSRFFKRQILLISGMMAMFTAAFFMVFGGAEAAADTTVDYEQFIQEELLPENGLVSLESCEKTLTSEEAWNNVGWTGKKGILGADAADLNQDGTDDLVVYAWEQYTMEGSDNLYNRLTAYVYTLDENQDIVLLTKRVLFNVNDVNYTRIKAGLMEYGGEDGKVYIYVESDVNAVFANGGGANYEWFYLAADNTLRHEWNLGVNCGGSSCMAISLLDYYDEGKGEINTLCKDGTFRQLGDYARKLSTADGEEDESCEEYLLWADGEHLDVYPDAKCEITGYDDMTSVWKLGFQKLGFTEIGIYNYSQNPYVDDGTALTFWDTKYMKESISYECIPTKTDGGYHFTVTLEDRTGLHQNTGESDSSDAENTASEEGSGKEPVNLEDQINLLVNTRDTWTGNENFGLYPDYVNCWVTDLDQDGLLEINASVTMGTGHFTTWDCYEVNEALDGITKVEWDNDTYAPDNYTSLVVKEQEWKDQVTETGFYDASASKYYYIMFDVVRSGAALNAYVFYAAALNENTMEFKSLGVNENAYDSSAQADVASYSVNDAAQDSEESFYAAMNEEMAGMQSTEYTLQRFTLSEASDLYTSLQESANYFSVQFTG